MKQVARGRQKFMRTLNDWDRFAKQVDQAGREGELISIS